MDEQTHKQIKTIRNESFDTVINFTNKELREKADRKPRTIGIFPHKYYDEMKVPHTIFISMIEYEETATQYDERKKKSEEWKQKNGQALASTKTIAKSEPKKDPVKEDDIEIDEVDI